MESSVLKAVKQFSLIERGDTVTVALSGGADSMALLHCLLSLKDELGINVNAAHLNHGIRGAEADRDELFVKNVCERSGVRLITEKADVPEIANREHLSLELAARQVRYNFFERVNEGKVATAHTASDNLETVLFNLSRGSSIKGLCGIPPKRGIFIRPLIFCTRQNVENYCRKNGIEYVTDSTNLSDDYSRNKIRHSVVPALKEINPAIEQTALRASLSLREDSAFLEKSAKEFLFANLGENSLKIIEFENISPAIAKRVIRNFFEICFPEISLENKHITDLYSLCLKGTGKTELPTGAFALVKNGELSLETGNNEEITRFSVKLTEISSDFSEKDKKINNLFLNNSLDCDKIVGKSVLRTRRSGDSIRLRNRGCTKTLKKLYTEYRVPIKVRDTLPVIADDNGVIWVYGIGVAERCAVKETAKRIIKIEAKEV